MGVVNSTTQDCCHFYNYFDLIGSQFNKVVIDLGAMGGSSRRSRCFRIVSGLEYIDLNRCHVGRCRHEEIWLENKWPGFEP